MKGSFVLIHAKSDEVEVRIEPSFYCPDGTVYFLSNPEKQSFLQMAPTLHSMELQRNEWIRKYDNLLKGLRFWEAKAKEHD